MLGVDIEEFTSITFPTLPSNELAGLTVGLGYCMGKYMYLVETAQEGFNHINCLNATAHKSGALIHREEPIMACHLP